MELMFETSPHNLWILLEIEEIRYTNYFIIDYDNDRMNDVMF